MKYGAKKDANHSEIMGVLGKLIPVMDVSDQGRGLPDGLALINGVIKLFDIKNPKTGYGRRGLNSVQQKWAESWAVIVYLIYTDQDAINFAAGRFDLVKQAGAIDRRAA